MKHFHVCILFTRVRERQQSKVQSWCNLSSIYKHAACTFYNRASLRGELFRIHENVLSIKCLNAFTDMHVVGAAGLYMYRSDNIKKLWLHRYNVCCILIACAWCFLLKMHFLITRIHSTFSKVEIVKYTSFYCCSRKSIFRSAY